MVMNSEMTEEYMMEYAMFWNYISDSERRECLENDGFKAFIKDRWERVGKYEGDESVRVLADKVVSVFADEDGEVKVGDCEYDNTSIVARTDGLIKVMHNGCTFIVLPDWNVCEGDPHLRYNHHYFDDVVDVENKAKTLLADIYEEIVQWWGV